VCALPGTTESEFHTVSGQEKFMRKAETAEKVARTGLKALAAGKSYVISGSEIISAPIVSASSLAAWSPKSPPECSSPARNNGPSRPHPDHREWVLFQFILPAKATSTRGSLCLRLTHCENKDFQALRPGGPVKGNFLTSRRESIDASGQNVLAGEMRIAEQGSDERSVGAGCQGR